MKILFSDDKYVDIDGVYNSQNDRVWALDHADAEEKDGVKQSRKHSPLSNGVVGCLFQGHNTLDNLQ